MYKTIYYNKTKNVIHLWDDVTGYKKFKYEDYAYTLTNEKTQYKSLFGENVKKVTDITKYNNDELLESDIRPEFKVLSDLYLDSDEVSTDNNILFFDIEVEVTDGFPNSHLVNNKVTAISLYFSKTKKYSVLLLNDESSIDDNDLTEIPSDYNIKLFDSEKDLLLYFIKLLQNNKPNIVTGWNIETFDIPYIYNRIKKQLGYKYANRLSPINIVKYQHDNANAIRTTIAGIDILDYISLYKQFTQNEQSSYSLENISQKELKRGKTKFDGSLNNLLRTNPLKFIEYSITDTELVVALDTKLNFIELARSICHRGHVTYENIKYSSIWLEGASLVYLHRKNIIAPNKKSKQIFELVQDHLSDDNIIKFKHNIDITTVPFNGVLRFKKSETNYFDVPYTEIKDNTITLKTKLHKFIKKSYTVLVALLGAYVKEPIAGLFKWIYDLDLVSLYPSIIRSLNISYETKIGRILQWDKDYLKNKTKKNYIIVYRDGTKQNITHEKLFKILSTNNIAVATNGVMYDTSTIGFIPSILTDWFGERVKMKDLMKYHKKKKDVYLSDYYNTRQWTMKIMLNSFYGVMALPSFRFYDMDNAEATTSTGQSIIKYTARKANEFYNNQTNSTQLPDNVIYTDTDSIFLSSLPLIPDKKLSDDEMIEKTIDVALQTQTYINDAYDVYVKEYHNLKGTHFLKIKQELVAKSGLWIAKKRYALDVINEEGITVDSNLQVTGLDVIRSDFPPAFKGVLTEILLSVMNDKSEKETTQIIKDFKHSFKKLKETDILSIMMSTGIRGLTKYDYDDRQKFTFGKGTPIHVKAGLFHNDFLQKNKQFNYDMIRNDDKIKWTKLLPNEYNINVIALKEQDNGYYEGLMDFVKNNIDIEENFNGKLLKKLEQIYKAMRWDVNAITQNYNESIDKLFNF